MESKTINMARRFALPQGEITAAPYGNGHINDTLCVCVKTPEGMRRYIMQRVNRYVFKQPEDVIANIARVTEYLRGIIAASPLCIYNTQIVSCDSFQPINCILQYLI